VARRQPLTPEVVGLVAARPRKWIAKKLGPDEKAATQLNHEWFVKGQKQLNQQTLE